MATYYVRKTGSDSNAGTSAGAAKLTIQAAVNLATTAGDIVYVGAGAYRETVTLAASGSSGNPIQIIGDYSGAQTGDAGVVRITGSDNDQTAVRNNCINTSTRSYVSITGFQLDGWASGQHALYSAAGGTDITLTKIVLTCGGGASHGYPIRVTGGGQARWTFDRCVLMGAISVGVGWWFDHTSLINNAGHVIVNCIAYGGYSGTGIRGDLVGGITVRNSLFSGLSVGIRYIGSPSVPSSPITVNNCVLDQVSDSSLLSDIAGAIVEDYNCLSRSAGRTNVSTGANSNTRFAPLDTRPLWAMLYGGTLVSPWDHASHSTLVELNSGTSAPSTDARGASVKGSFREWGPLEYDSTLSTSGGSALGLPVVGSAIVRGVG